MTSYLSIADVARELGVKEQTVVTWRARHADTPEPDVIVGGKFPGWISAAAWQKWNAGRADARAAARKPA